MRKEKQNVSVTKMNLKKCKGIAKAFDATQTEAAKKLAEDDTVVEFSMNVPLDFSTVTLSPGVDPPSVPHTTDFLLVMKNGAYAVREAVPEYDESIRRLPPPQRMQYTSRLNEICQPLDMTVSLYYQVMTSLQQSFAQKVGVESTRAFQRNYLDMKNRRISAATGAGTSFSLIGVSGMGKSRALQQVLSLFPEVIAHKEYAGEPLICKQIPYIVVQTPHDASVRSLCLDIMAQIDDVCGTKYFDRAKSSRLTKDQTVIQIAQYAKAANVGLLVVDEIQNVKSGKGEDDQAFLNFLVQLINSANLSVCMVGTPEAFAPLQKQFHSARRATGLECDVLTETEFFILLNAIWPYQYTAHFTPLTPEVANWLYRCCEGCHPYSSTCSPMHNEAL